jgi:glycerol-3-phosphate dehydrogenase (NAD(P)+)
VGGGRWARALCGALFDNARRAPERVSEVLHYRPPRDDKASPPVGSSDDEAAVPAAAASEPPKESLAKSIELSGLAAADLIVLAVPATTVRGLLQAASPHLGGAHFLVHAIGSLAPAGDRGEDVTLISRVVRQLTPVRRIGALAGPALAPDLEQARPAALICGSRFAEVGEAVIQALAGPALRMYTTTDLIGVEVARAGAACIALASGIAAALDLGTAVRAILIARGAAEMARLGVALGGNKETFFGLAGVGELVVATERHGSADFELGRLLGQGRTLAQAQREVGRVCDGPSMVHKAYALGLQDKLRMPLCTALYHFIAGTHDQKSVLAELFGSVNRSE